MQIAKMLEKAACGIAVLTSASILGAQVAFASTDTFSFRRAIGSVWVGDVTVTQDMFNHHYPAQPGSNSLGGGRNTSSLPSMSPPTPARDVAEPGVLIQASLHLPTCSSGAHTEGQVVVRYTNGDAYITRTYSVNRDNEGQRVNPEWFVWGYYGEPANGNVNVETQVSCVNHQVEDTVDDIGDTLWDILNPFDW